MHGQAKSPSCHANCKATPWVEDARFTHIAKQASRRCQPANARRGLHKLWFDSIEDAEELNHLQWNCRRPIDASVHNWGLLDGHPVHVHRNGLQTPAGVMTTPQS